MSYCVSACSESQYCPVVKSFYSVESIGGNTKAAVKTLTPGQDLTCDLRLVRNSERTHGDNDCWRFQAV